MRAVPVADAPMDGPTDALTRVLDGARRPALLITDLDLPEDLDGVQARVRPGEPKPEGQFRTVVLLASDVAELRRAALLAASAKTAGWAREIGIVVLDATRDTGTSVLTLRPHPAWPPADAVRAELVGATALTRVEFSRRLAAGPVLAGFAHVAGSLDGTRAEDGHLGVRVLPPGADSTDPEVKHPPDVAIDPPEPPVVAEATGRAAVVLTAAEAAPALDDAVYRPTGFRRDWSRGLVDLPAHTRLSPRLVHDLRDAQGVRLAPGHDPALAAGLAMSGVPLIGDLADLAGVTDSDLADPVRREEASVRQRRAALAAQAPMGRRHALAERAGVRAAAEPSISVLLTLSRPELLEHALRQVDHQRVAPAQIVLAAHGFTLDRPFGRQGPRPDPAPVTIVTADAGTPAASLLARAAEAATGEVIVTMHGHDWYGPDVLTDLLLARRYSGATAVSMAAEWVYSEPVDASWRRPVETEVFTSDVDGPTLLLERALLRRLGGWPADRGVGSLVRESGGTGYRVHGLGHVRRDDRTSEAPAHARPGRKSLP